ncbi:acetyl-CoA hydrolase/transferase family protein [Novosphingobium tardum]|uniref:Acetyl-CoA hydrolase/transferase family protein n=1 Tax=Novosphingobium tardum TaxID=1538021 RepID=A0ABV8RNH4_9SPHN
MDHAEEYRAKLVSPEEAMSLVGGGSDVAMGMALSEPPALLAALAARVEQGGLDGFNLWYFHSLTHAEATVLKFELTDRIRPHCMFLTGIERELMRRGAQAGISPVEYVPTAFSEAPRLLSEKVSLDTFLVTVSPMDRNGWFTFGTGNDYATVAARSARRLVVEVNRHMPRVFGDSLLHVSEVDAIVENHVPLPDLNSREPTPEELTIARTIAGLIDDGACLQMGIGSLPSAVCAELADRRDLGVHTELLTPGLACLIQSGAVTNRRKATYQGRSVFTFAMGNKALYDFLDDNPSMHSLPVNIVNDPRHIAKNDNVVSINATLQVDLSGACNSEHVLGRQYSGSGGQLDFVRGARASKGGKSIIACTSTARDGTVSRIVPTLTGPVTTPRNDVQIVVTEHGWADLAGKTLTQRADALISLADPRFRDDLANAQGRL